MIKTNLSIPDFTKYFEANRLGTLCFPNGPREAVSLEGPTGYKRIQLRNLYKIATQWKINRTEIPLDDIIAVMAYGPAVQKPGFNCVTVEKRKFLQLGKKIKSTKKIPIEFDYADFLVLTEQDRNEEESLEGDNWFIHPGFFHQGETETGIHRLYNGARNPTNRTALEEGIPIFYNAGRLEEVLGELGIHSKPKRELYWDEGKEQVLHGRIE